MNLKDLCLGHIETSSFKSYLKEAKSENREEEKHGKASVDLLVAIVKERLMESSLDIRKARKSRENN